MAILSVETKKAEDLPQVETVKDDDRVVLWDGSGLKTATANILIPELDIEDFTEQVEFTAGTGTWASFIRYGNLVVASYQSGNTTDFAASTTLFTLPEGYRPVVNGNAIGIIFTINAAGYGNARLNPDGTCTINQISGGSSGQRLYMNFSYVIAEEE